MRRCWASRMTRTAAMSPPMCRPARTARPLRTRSLLPKFPMHPVPRQSRMHRLRIKRRTFLPHRNPQSRKRRTHPPCRSLQSRSSRTVRPIRPLLSLRRILLNLIRPYPKRIRAAPRPPRKKPRRTGTKKKAKKRPAMRRPPNPPNPPNCACPLCGRSMTLMRHSTAIPLK